MPDCFCGTEILCPICANSGITETESGIRAIDCTKFEGLLGESMVKYGRAMGDDSTFGKALLDSGEAYKQMADIKYALEDTVKQNFLDPLAHLLNTDLKEVNVSPNRDFFHFFLLAYFSIASVFLLLFKNANASSLKEQKGKV